MPKNQSTSPGEIGRIFRGGSGRATATLIRIFGDVEVAEDAVQDAFATALETWPTTGLPPNPLAWILTTARNRAIDRLRRESLGRAILADTVAERTKHFDSPAHTPDPMDDDQLRLIFTCCHPALSNEAQVALTLRLLCGLTTTEVARAFLVENPTMAQRLVRAKRKIKSAHIPYRIPESTELPERLLPVLATCYLVYNAGANNTERTGAGNPTNNSTTNLAHEAIRLTRLLHELMPNQTEVAGLLALMLFNESRRPARFAQDGSPILLRDQNRSTWNHHHINEAQTILRACITRDEPGPYQIQAAIQAVHTSARAFDQTDWPQITRLYDELLHFTPTPIVQLNRAIAIAELAGGGHRQVTEALAIIEPLPLENYYLFHSTRANFLARLNRYHEAEAAYRTAASQAPAGSERAFLTQLANDCKRT